MQVDISPIGATKEASSVKAGPWFVKVSKSNLNQQISKKQKYISLSQFISITKAPEQIGII